MFLEEHSTTQKDNKTPMTSPPNVMVSTISQAERIRREKSVRAATTSVVLEGFVIPAAAHEIDRRYTAAKSEHARCPTS